MRERELKGEVREKRSDGKRKSGERGASVGRPAVEKRKEMREPGLTGLRRAKREEKREQERGGWSFKGRRDRDKPSERRAWGRKGRNEREKEKASEE